MKVSYDEMIEQLEFDTSEYRTDYCCGCGPFSAVIIDGENKYTWSIFEKEMPVLSQIPALAELLVHGDGEKADKT